MSKPILEDPVDTSRRIFFLHAQKKAAEFGKTGKGFAELLGDLVMENLYNRRFLTPGVLKCLQDKLIEGDNAPADKVPVHSGKAENSSLAMAV